MRARAMCNASMNVGDKNLHCERAHPQTGKVQVYACECISCEAHLSKDKNWSGSQAKHCVLCRSFHRIREDARCPQDHCCSQDTSCRRHRPAARTQIACSQNHASYRPRGLQVITKPLDGRPHRGDVTASCTVSTEWPQPRFRRRFEPTAQPRQSGPQQRRTFIFLETRSTAGPHTSTSDPDRSKEALDVTCAGTVGNLGTSPAWSPNLSSSAWMCPSMPACKGSSTTCAVRLRHCPRRARPAAHAHAYAWSVLGDWEQHAEATDAACSPSRGAFVRRP